MLNCCARRRRGFSHWSVIKPAGFLTERRLRVRRLFALPIALVLLWPCNSRAQEQLVISEDLIQSIEEWARENIDESVLEALEQVDQDRVRGFFTELRQRLEGASVYDLSSLKDTASRLLPLLETFEETRPYAAWLQTHIDYFEAADELRREMKPTTPKPATPAPLPNPPPQLQRTLWTKKLEKRLLPPPCSDPRAALEGDFCSRKNAARVGLAR